jgi:hypothetical protein
MSCADFGDVGRDRQVMPSRATPREHRCGPLGESSLHEIERAFAPPDESGVLALECEIAPPVRHGIATGVDPGRGSSGAASLLTCRCKGRAVLCLDLGSALNSGQRVSGAGTDC